MGISLFILLIAGTILLRLPEESAPLDEVTAVNQPVVDGRVTVEVLNAGGVSGVAREATAALRSSGIWQQPQGHKQWHEQIPMLE